MKDVLVSVIMPTYNHARFLSEAIKSVLNQTYSNIELVIVDNYSADNTEEIVRSFNDARIRYFKFTNKGIIAASRNHGIEQAKGDVFAFIDSDDIWFNNKIALQMERLRQDQDNGLVCCYFSVLSDEKRNQNKRLGPRRADVSGFVYKKLLNNNFIVSSSTLVTRQAIEDVGGFDENEALRTAEDFDLWLRIARKYKVIFVPETLGSYRMHETNASTQDSRLHRALAVIDKHFSQQWITKCERNLAKANFSLNVAWTLIESERRQARQHIREAIKYNKMNLKIVTLGGIAMIFTLVPGLFKWIRNHRIDRAIATKVLHT